MHLLELFLMTVQIYEHELALNYFVCLVLLALLIAMHIFKLLFLCFSPLLFAVGICHIRMAKPSTFRRFFSSFFFPFLSNF